MFFRRGVDVKSFAISQIFIMILATFSFAFIIAESSNVSAQGEELTAEEFRQQQTQFAQEYSGSSSTIPVEPPAAPKSPITFDPSTTSSSFATSYNVVGGTAKYNGQAFTRAVQGADGKYELFNSQGTSVAKGVDPSVVNNAIGEGGGSLTEAIPKSEQTFFGRNPLGNTGFLNNLASGAIWGAAAAAIVYFAGDFIGLDENQKEAASIALGAGVGIARFGFLQATNSAGAATGSGFWSGAGFGGEAGIGVGGGATLWAIGIAAVIYIAIYRKETQKVISFQCLPYEAPTGGRDCEECNGDPFRPCSEYRCRALGQACELVNVGSTEEKCVWVNPNDATSPTITPWDEPLTENHRYTSHETRPTSLGTKIVYNNNANGCLQAFTPLAFGIVTNEPAQCKIDIDHKDTFESMQYFFGNNNLFLYNHTQQFSLPSPDAVNAEAPELLTDGKYDFFVRCRDKNGNENVDEYAIQLCVDPSPDTTAPVIVDTAIPSDSYVKFGSQSVPMEFYVNEPSICKWSTQDKEYSVMENTMSCATSLTQINARELYTCFTNLTGIVDRQVNNYFVRCKDQPSKPEEDRNVNVVSYKYNLKGSQPLNIIFTSPNGTVTGNTNTVPVDLKITTDDGANEGNAICSFSPSGNPSSYVLMFETDAVEHTQRLDLPTGNYNYKFRCVDYGGNAAEAETSFTVIVDTFSPMITRAYRDSSNDALKIVTNEDAECAYSLNSCNFNFDEGIEMLYLSASNKKNHYSEWKPNVAYYIKCRDVFNNEPGPNTCSLVASATNIK